MQYTVHWVDGWDDDLDEMLGVATMLHSRPFRSLAKARRFAMQPAILSMAEGNFGEGCAVILDQHGRRVPWDDDSNPIPPAPPAKSVPALVA